MITEVSTTQGINTASIEFLNPFQGQGEGQENMTAWWHEDEIEIIDNLPDLLSRELKHPFGHDSLQPFKDN